VRFDDWKGWKLMFLDWPWGHPTFCPLGTGDFSSDDKAAKA